MPRYYNLTGDVVEVSDQEAAAYGYQPIDVAQETTGLLAEGAARRGEGVGAAVGSFARGAASGLTLGLSDVAQGALGTEAVNQDIVAAQAANPEARFAGEVVGALAGAFAPTGSVLGSTPAGYLSRASAEVAETSLAAGRPIGALGAIGAEGAAQNVGQYLGHAALADKEVTAEGLAGAAGVGFAFGAAGGGLALGVRQGTIAARRMFSRVMDGGEDAAQDAALAWDKQRQAIHEANEETLRVARQELDQIRLRQREAETARLRARASEAEAQAIAGRERLAEETAPPELENLARAFRAAGDETGVAPGAALSEVPPAPAAPGAVSPAPGAASLDDLLPAPAAIEALPPRALDPATGVGEAPSGLEGLVRAQRDVAEGLDLDAALGRVDAAAQESRLAEQLEATALAKVPQPRAAAETAPLRTIPEATPAPAAPRAARPTEPNRPGAMVEPPSSPFSEEVYAAAQHAEKYGDKAFLSSIYDNMRPELRPASLADFKRQLMASMRRGEVMLSRADLVQAMDKRLVDASTIKDGGSEFQFVDVTTKPKARPQSRRERMLARQDQEAALRARVESRGGARGVEFDPVAPRTPEPEVLPPAVAKRRDELLEALEEFESARSAFLDDAIDASARRQVATAPQMVPLDFAKVPEAPQPGTSVGSGRGRRAAAEPPAPADATGAATPRSRRLAELDDAADDALERAGAAEGDAAAIASREADAAEAQLAREAAPDSLADDVGRAADQITRYEKATARLAEAVGDVSHPTTREIAKQFDEASEAAVRRAMDRIARAAEDVETFGPPRPSPRERSLAARQASLEAGAELARIKAAVSEAADKFARAKLAAQPKGAVRVDGGATPFDNLGRGTKKQWGGAGSAEVGGIYELVDVPGLPKAGDLPVVGPLLSAWLKYRALKAAMGRFTGRVPATGDARAASLASRTKDRVARSVDRMLGVAERGAASAVVPATAVSAALSRRIYDDGEPDAPRGDVRTQAQVRARELAAYAANPAAIERDVRRELREVSDPDVITAAVAHRQAMIAHLAEVSPRAPDPNPLAPRVVPPSAAEAMAFGRRLAVANNPEVAFEAARRGELTIEMSETLRATFPRLFELAQLRVMQQATKLEQSVPYRMRAMMTLLFDRPMDPSLNPVNIKISQSVFAPPASAEVPAAPGPAPTPPVPSMAGDVNLNALYSPALDRRSR